MEIRDRDYKNDETTTWLEMVIPDHPCAKCGLEMSKNPHPDAGKPETLLVVGAVYECIPCARRLNHHLHLRAVSQNKKVKNLRKALREYMRSYGAYLMETRQDIIDRTTKKEENQ